MSRGYSFTHSPVTDASAGDPTTGTLWCDSYEQNQDTLLNDVLGDIDTDVTFLYAQVGADDPDNVTFQYKDSSTVTVSSGQAGAFTINSATDVDFTGATISTRYYLWVGEDSVAGTTAIKKGTSLSTAPAELISATAHRLRWYVDIDGSGNVDPFWFPFGDDIDDVLIEYIDTDDIKVLAGGKFTDHTGQLWRVEEDVTVNTASDLTAADTLTADTYYYVWAGEDSSGDLAFVLSDDGDVLPAELVQGRCLRPGISIYDDSGTLKIRQFVNDGLWYQYSAPITIYTAGTMPTTNTSIDLSAYVPANVRRGIFWSSSNYTSSSAASPPGELIMINDLFVSNGDYSNNTTGSANATFEAAISQSIDFRCYHAYTTGTLRLIRWEV